MVVRDGTDPLTSAQLRFIDQYMQSCPVAEVDEQEEMRDASVMPVQSFTPLLGTLLLSPNSSVSSATRQCIVNLVQRIRSLDKENAKDGTLGAVERRLFEKEIMEQVVIGMAHLEQSAEAMDEDLASEQQTGSSMSDSSRSSQEQLRTMSATGDADLLTMLSPSAIAASQLDRLDDAPQDDPQYPLSLNIDRPPSPVPAPLSRSASTSPASVEEMDVLSLVSPLSLPPSIPSSIPPSEMNATPLDDARSDYSDEQNAIGRLASMSLMAAVTASGESIPQSRHFHALISED
jgi:serine/threonine-protein phosphatase 4 regulatory subunit 1